MVTRLECCSLVTVKKTMSYRKRCSWFPFLLVLSSSVQLNELLTAGFSKVVGLPGQVGLQAALILSFGRERRAQKGCSLLADVKYSLQINSVLMYPIM